MTLLVNCTKCHRNYDATGRELGSRFRCHCGEIVIVAEPKEKNGHNAAVVRCSSCGAPRKGQAEACTYCHADFTLHERDLHTVCPGCFARVSDKAHFCHSCGDNLQGESCASMGTDLPCPNCGEEQMLQQRSFGESAHLMECSSCTGMWVRNSVLKGLLKRAKEEVDEFQLDGGPERPLQSVDNRHAEAPIYRECPDCKHHMRRHIFAKKSGIVIDSCKEHGIWFDAEELELILKWVRAGGSAASNDNSVPKPAAAKGTGDYTPVRRTRSTNSGGTALSDVLDDAFEMIGKMFFRGRF